MSADARLKSYAERVLKLMDERDGVTGDISDVFQEVKSAGFNAPAFRKVIVAMRMDPEKRESLEFDIDAYRLAVGLDRARADEMLAEGAGIRETNRATGVPLGTLHRRSKTVAKSKNGTPQSEAAPSALSDGSAGQELQAASDTSTPKSSAAVAPVASPLPLADVGAFPPAALDTPDDHDWERRDGAATFHLGHRVGNGVEPHPSTPDTARTQATVDALRTQALIARQMPPPPPAEIDMPEIPGWLRRA